MPAALNLGFISGSKNWDDQTYELAGLIVIYLLVARFINSVGKRNQ